MDVDIVVGIAGFMSEWPRLKHHESLMRFRTSPAPHPLFFFVFITLEPRVE